MRAPCAHRSILWIRNSSGMTAASTRPGETTANSRSSTARAEHRAPSLRCQDAHTAPDLNNPRPRGHRAARPRWGAKPLNAAIPGRVREARPARGYETTAAPRRWNGSAERRHRKIVSHHPTPRHVKFVGHHAPPRHENFGGRHATRHHENSAVVAQRAVIGKSPVDPRHDLACDFRTAPAGPSVPSPGRRGPNGAALARGATFAFRGKRP